MKREDAIKTLKELWRETNDPWYEEVYNMAINALEADHKTENSSEKPNKCEDCRSWNHNYGACTEIECNYEPNNFDKDINVRSKDEPQTCSVNGRPYTDCSRCEYFRCTADEPQAERSE